MRYQGVVEAVQVSTVGTWVVGDVSAGVTSLPIDDMSAFLEAGGVALVDGAEVSYSAAVDDEAGDYLTLTEPLASDVPDHAWVTTSPAVQVKTAMVNVDGDTWYCDVRSGPLWQDARLGGTATGGQPVTVERLGNSGRWRVVALPGSAPSPDASYVTPGTLALEAVNLDAAALTNALVPILQATDLYGVSLAPTVLADDGAGNQIIFDSARVALSIYRGNALVQRLDADHSIIQDAILGASQLTVDGTAELRGATVVNPGGSLQLLSQVQPPPVPAVAVGWRFVTVTPPPVAVNTSLTYVTSPDKFYFPAAYMLQGVADGGAGLMLDLRSFDPDGGNVTTEWSRPLAAENLKRGIVKIGTSFYIMVALGPSGADAAVQERVAATGVLANQWPVPFTGTIQCLGTDGTDLLISSDNLPMNEWDIRTFSTSGTLLDTITTDTGGNGLGVMSYLAKGTFDFGGDRIVLGAAGAWAGVDVLDADGVRQLSEEWKEAPFYSGPKTSCGMAWYAPDGYFVEFATDGTLYRYTGAETSLGWLGTAPYSAVITYRDGGTSETTMSAAFDFTMDARKEITVTGPQLPAGADREALYLARVSSPTRTDYYLQGTPAAGDTSWTIDIPTFTGANPPATSTFPMGTAPLVGGDGSVIVDSDYSNAHDLDFRVSTLEAGGGGGGGTGGVDIDCGDASATGVEIDCGAA